MACAKPLPAILVFIFSIFLQASGQNSRPREIFPFNTPEQQGISSRTLDSLLLFIKETNQNIHHLTIIRNDHTVIDADFYPYSSHNLHDLASVTKSITALLIGIAIDRKFIRDENQLVLTFFPEVVSHDSLRYALRVKDLVTMTSGFACGTVDGERALSDMRKTDDWVKFIFDLPMISKPGETFSYCSCNFYLLAEIIFRAAHMTPHEFAKKYLFEPLEIDHSIWLSNYKNINHGWGDLFLYPADMDKIGKLMLDSGRWQNRQIVSREWVAKCLKTYSRLNDEKGYGYGWWTYEKGGFYEAAGRGRQTISIIPSRHMIVTMLGGEFDAGTIGKYIFQSIKSNQPLPENKNAYAELKNLMKEVAVVPPVREKMLMNDTLVKALNGRFIVFEKNISGIDSLIFHFTLSTGGTVIFFRGKNKEEHPFLLSAKKYAISMDNTPGLPVALQAEFSSHSEFILHYNQLCRINNFYFRFTVHNENILTHMEETSNFIKTDIAGSFSK
ncbi:MAG TPA: serine hydrolase [Puia sp.]|nr:serine hydrolase [Puia sp.]